MDIEHKEISDLLQDKRKVEIVNGNAQSTEASEEPPDGGLRAYLVLVGSFITNGLLFGVINSFSPINSALGKELANNGDDSVNTRISLVGSMAMGTTFLLSPISGLMTGLLGIQLTVFIGGTIAAVGLLISSFAVHNVDALIFTHGIMYGLGASFAYTPSLAILGHYFKRYLGRVNGVVTIGSSVFTLFIPSPLMKHMISTYGIDWLFRLLALLTFGIALCGLLFKPIVGTQKSNNYNFRSQIKQIFSFQIFKIRKYKLWALFMPVALCGYFVPYIHFHDLMEYTFKGVNYDLPLQCMALASGVGRLIFGYLADNPKIDRILMQQISFYVIGMLTIILPFVQVFPLVVAISFGMGFFEGAFISLIGPIAVQLCGTANAAQAIGCMLGLTALPLSLGPPFAAYLFRKQNSYVLPFVLAGITPLVGATLMFIIRLKSRGNNGRADTNGHVVSQIDAEKSATPLVHMNGNVNHQTPL